MRVAKADATPERTLIDRLMSREWGDRQHRQLRDAAALRIAELETALREIAHQCRVADDPEHMTLDLIRRIAEDATK